MGIHRQLPDRLRQLHPKYRTPWIGILLFSAIAIGTILPGQEAFLGNLYAFGALLSFTFAHASVARLRAKKKDVPRPYRGPGNLTIRGYDAPLFAIVGGTFTVRRVRRDRRPLPDGERVRRRLARARDRRLHHLPAPPGPRPDLHAQGRDRAAGRRPRGGVRLRARPLRRLGLRRPGARHRAQARRAQAPRHPRARDDHRAELDGDRRADARPGRERPQHHRGGQGRGRRAA